MSDWQERITRETPPAIWVEHELRYRAAAPLIRSGGPWADLGCGNGLAAAAALGDAVPPSALLVDVDERAVAQAARELGIDSAVQLSADLSERAGLERVGEQLIALGDMPTITCFEVVEHLDSFLPLLEWSRAFADERQATFVLSVPNDAFWSIENPYHRTVWSEGAFAELRSLLPREHTLLRQVALGGSVFVGWDQRPLEHELRVTAGGEGGVASHFIAAFGPRHAQLYAGALVAQTDSLAQRRWERQRESDVAIALAEAREAVKEMEATVARQAGELREQTTQFDEWRAYIHELERELGRPLSGSEGAVAASQSENPHAGSEQDGASAQAEPPA